MGKGRLLLAIAGMLLLGSAFQAQDGYRIIVNPANPIATLTKAQVSRFFLEQATWDDGQPVAPVDLVAPSPVREVFSREILDMPTSAVVARWRESGSRRGEPPPSVASDRDVLAYVRLKPGAIGYVSAAADLQGVKAVSIGGRAAERAAASAPQPIDVGGAVLAPEKIVDVPPIYPGIARSARVEGVVEVEVVVGTTGKVEQTRVVHSVAVLDAAAVVAIRQWKYRPTIINGVAVPVRMRVRVAFSL